MTGPGSEVRCRPTPAQQLLLDACLAPDDDARIAWRAWCGSIDIDRIEEESFRHLPLAFHRHRDLTPRDRSLDLAGGVYRQSWYRNQILLRELGSVLDRLGGQSIDVLLLKGASLATRYYPTPATRPLGDIDVLVRHRDASRAVSLLVADGWVPVKQTPVATLVRHFHGVSLRRGSANLDLHWNALWSKRTADADTDFWDAAEATEHQGRPAWALSASDELFHACMHGARQSQNAYSWQPVPLIRWVSDAVHVQRARSVNWSRVATLAEHYHARLHMLDAFRYLRSAHGVAVPAGLLESWAGVRSRADRLHYELALTRRAPRLFPSLPRFKFWQSYRMKMYCDFGAERVDSMRLLRVAAGFPAYLVSFMKADLDTASLRALPGRLVRKLIERPSLMRP